MKEQNRQHAWEAEMQVEQGNMEEAELQNMDQTEDLGNLAWVAEPRVHDELALVLRRPHVDEHVA